MSVIRCGTMQCNGNTSACESCHQKCEIWKTLPCPRCNGPSTYANTCAKCVAKSEIFVMGGFTEILTESRNKSKEFWASFAQVKGEK